MVVCRVLCETVKDFVAKVGGLKADGDVVSDEQPEEESISNQVWMGSTTDKGK